MAPRSLTITVGWRICPLCNFFATTVDIETGKTSPCPYCDGHGILTWVVK